MTLSTLLSLLQADLLRFSMPATGIMEPQPRWWNLLSPRFVPVLLIRVARYCHVSRWLRILSPIFTWLNFILFGIEFTARCDAGPGLMLPHTSGTVVGALKIGRNATIFQGVTLGAKFVDLAFDPEARPVVGNEVTIGAGAKVLGGISVGDGAVIAANSLVIENVAPGALMIGVPAHAKEVQQ